MSEPKSNMVIADTSEIDIGSGSGSSKINKDKKNKFIKKKN